MMLSQREKRKEQESDEVKNRFLTVEIGNLDSKHYVDHNESLKEFSVLLNNIIDQ